MGDLISWPIHIGSTKLRKMTEHRHQLMAGPSIELSCECGARITVYEKADIKAYPFRIFYAVHKKCSPDNFWWPNV